MIDSITRPGGQLLGLYLLAIAPMTGSTITNTTDVVDDGAESDGRTILTGADVVAQIAATEAIIAQFGANGGALLAQVTKAAVNG